MVGKAFSIVGWVEINLSDIKLYSYAISGSFMYIYIKKMSVKQKRRKTVYQNYSSKTLTHYYKL